VNEVDTSSLRPIVERLTFRAGGSAIASGDTTANLLCVFHVELRQFPHVTRVFNLDRDELDKRFTRPWASGATVEQEERRWSPARARLTIIEAPELPLDEIGMGRGWATVGKTGQDVTATVLAEAQRGAEGRSTVEGFKAEIRAAAPLTACAVVELAVAQYPLWRASEHLALAEQSVWELLHQGGLTLSGPDGQIGPEDWQAVVISWSTWTGEELMLEPVA
jgi:hypothetical protein